MTKPLFRSRGFWAAAIIVAVILLDQVLKIWVKTSFYYGESFRIASWFQLVFIENNGMAFGWQIGSKLLLTLFRIATVAYCFLKSPECTGADDYEPQRKSQSISLERVKRQ